VCVCVCMQVYRQPSIYDDISQVNGLTRLPMLKDWEFMGAVPFLPCASLTLTGLGPECDQVNYE
jgi:hypothetical protein